MKGVGGAADDVAVGAEGLGQQLGDLLSFHELIRLQTLESRKPTPVSKQLTTNQQS